MLSMLASVALASDPATLRGERCDAAGCVPYEMELHPNGRAVDSDGRAGTWTLDEVRGVRVLGWDFPDDRFSGTASEGPENCWVDPGPPLNPQLGLINVCFAANDLQLLRQYDPACESVPLMVTSPAPGEDGHWAAGRLTPETAGGMWVHEVQYHMVADALHCGKVDHRVQVFLSDAASPPDATPVVVHELQVDGGTLLTGEQLRQLWLPDPIFVPAGQSLFVSVEMAVDASGDVCEAACDLGGLQGDQSYWSNSATTPYAWQDLNSWGIPELMVRALVLHVP